MFNIENIQNGQSVSNSVLGSLISHQCFQQTGTQSIGTIIYFPSSGKAGESVTSLSQLNMAPEGTTVVAHDSNYGRIEILKAGQSWSVTSKSVY